MSVGGRGKLKGEGRDRRRGEGEGYAGEIAIEHRHIRGTGTDRTGRAACRVGRVDRSKMVVKTANRVDEVGLEAREKGGLRDRYRIGG